MQWTNISIKHNGIAKLEVNRTGMLVGDPAILEIGFLPRESPAPEACRLSGDED